MQRQAKPLETSKRTSFRPSWLGNNESLDVEINTPGHQAQNKG
jgi:hypothetical protein